MKSFKSFEELYQRNFNLIEHLKNLNTFYAHLHESKDKETLYTHTSLVVNYFFKLIKAHQLESIVDNLINSISFNDKIIAEYTKKLFLDTIIYHDFGKINPNFQVQNMKNTECTLDSKLKIGSEHSYLSAYIFLNNNLNYIYQQLQTSNENKNILACYSFLFNITILKHHSGAILKDYEFDPDKNNSIFHLIKTLSIEPDFNFIEEFFKNENKLWEFFDSYVDSKSFNYFSLFALLKLNWSLLTAADYYATTEYMNDLKIEDFGLLDDNLKKQILKKFSETKKYNKALLENYDTYLSIEPKTLFKSPENLNLLRQRLGAEVLSNLEKYKDDYIFYIEAPTGGGKTNLSLIAVIKLLDLHPEINKVFYVFPFTTLITQTHKYIKNIFGLTDYHIAQIYSSSGIQGSLNEEDALYGENYKNQIDNVFVNFPFTLLTHIKFFDILTSNDKKSNYLLHRIANSIVIIDEIQAYNPEYWDKIKYFISNYAKYFNIRFILMSATLPKLHNIAISENEILNFEDLIENPQENYLQNPNFCQRVQIKTDLIDNNNISLEELAEFIQCKSEEFSINRKDNYRNSIFTIVEFIFKKTATEFYQTIRNKDLFNDYEVFVLSGTIIEPRRKYIIEYLKDPENRQKKVLLISTQVVEAGVDIDMDLGFKNQSIIDSDEQLAGRINRNLTKEGCELYLFKYNEPQKIYGGDLRYKVSRNLEKTTLQNILQEKKFDMLYQEVMKQINLTNSSVYKENLNDYINYIKNIDFENINSEFKLIKSDTVSIFVPINIPVVCYKDEKNFSEIELDFLKNAGICNTGNSYISGEDIWKLYISLIHNKEFTVKEKSLKIKMLNAIMSKFVFSVFSTQLKELMPYLEYNEDTHNYMFYQFYKINAANLHDIYTIESGLNDSRLKMAYEFF